MLPEVKITHFRIVLAPRDLRLNVDLCGATTWRLPGVDPRFFVAFVDMHSRHPGVLDLGDIINGGGGGEI